MKQLKFMLAAATAVGIATVAQAAATDQYAASTGFEDIPADDLVTTGTDAYFYYDGEVGDNESKVVVGTASGMDRRPYGTAYFTEKVSSKVLNVNTGTNALFRAISEFTDAPAPQELTVDTYVDTLVKFTVTPAGDSVVNTAEDKLMVYLKEFTNEVAGVIQYSTNLVVKAGYLGSDSPVTAVPKEYIVNNANLVIEPNVWYRLTVKAIPNLATPESAVYYPAFAVSVNGVPCTFDTASIDVTSNDIVGFMLAQCGEVNVTLLQERSVVLSLLANGTSSAKFTAVGFAGEGYVDDLIITKEDPTVPVSTGVDFTLALDEGVSAVTWTIVDGGETITTTKKYSKIAAGTYKITNVEYADWFVADGDYSEGSDVTVADGQTVTVLAKAATVEDLDVKNPTGADTTTVNAALAWAKAAGKTTAAVEGAANIVANYLLNVDNLAVEPKIEIVSIDASTKPMTITAKVTDANGTTYEKTIIGEGAAGINASIKYKAAATLEALKNAAAKDAIGADDKFVQVVVE